MPGARLEGPSMVNLFGCFGLIGVEAAWRATGLRRIVTRTVLATLRVRVFPGGRIERLWSGDEDEELLVLFDTARRFRHCLAREVCLTENSGSFDLRRTEIWFSLITLYVSIT